MTTHQSYLLSMSTSTAVPRLSTLERATPVPQGSEEPATQATLYILALPTLVPTLPLDPHPPQPPLLEQATREHLVPLHPLPLLLPLLVPLVRPLDPQVLPTLEHLVPLHPLPQLLPLLVSLEHQQATQEHLPQLHPPPLPLPLLVPATQDQPTLERLQPPLDPPPPLVLVTQEPEVLMLLQTHLLQVRPLQVYLRSHTDYQSHLNNVLWLSSRLAIQ